MDIAYSGHINFPKKETYICDYTTLLSSLNVHIVAAVGNRGEMGNKGELLWHLPNDKRRFKELTFGHTVLMGRKTWESLPIKPLPGRRNIVLTHHEDFVSTECEHFLSPAEALATLPHNESLFVIGGAEIFQEFLPMAKTIYLTRVLNDFAADTFFPAVDWTKWNLVEDVFVPQDEKNSYDCRFQKWEREY